MPVTAVTPQIRTTNLEESIQFYTATLGFDLAFQVEDFYAGIRVTDSHMIHLKLVDDPDPSISVVQAGYHLHLAFTVEDVHALAAALKGKGVTVHKDLSETPWGFTDFYILDPQGHVLCFASGGDDETPQQS